MHNIDRFMRQQGFMLYGMTGLVQYSRAALPAQFFYRAPYNTITGQPLQTDFIYFRDCAADDYSDVWEADVSTAKLLKLACLYDLFLLPDCAAELIVKHRHSIAAIADPDILLDCLTPPLNGRKLTYAEYIAEFETSFQTFYPAAATKQVPTAGGDDALAATNAELSAARTELQRASEQLDAERTEHRAVQAQLKECHDQLVAAERLSCVANSQLGVAQAEVLRLRERLASESTKLAEAERHAKALGAKLLAAQTHLRATQARLHATQEKLQRVRASRWSRLGQLYSRMFAWLRPTGRH
jgi:hypothetical protein